MRNIKSSIKAINSNYILSDFTSLLLNNKLTKKTVIENILNLLGLNFNLDRVFICENTYKENVLEAFNYKYEWIAKGASERKTKLIRKKENWILFEDFKKLLLNNNQFTANSINPKDLELRILDIHQSENFIASPIFVDSVFFGFIGFDDNDKERTWDEIDWSVICSIAKNLGIYLSQIKSNKISHNKGQQHFKEDDLLENEINISELKQKEILLTKLNLVIENLPLGVAILDNEGIYCRINNYHANIFGYQVDELNGMKWTQLYEQPEIENIINNYFPILDEKGFWSGETTGIKKNGELLVQELVLSSTADGGLVCLTRDITQIKKELNEINSLNNQLELALRAANLGMWVFNKQNDIIKHNDILLKLIGYTNSEIENFTLDKWISLIHPDDQSNVEEAIEKLHHNPDGIFRVEYRILHKQGDYIWILGIGKIFENSKNKVDLEITCFNIDITSLKEAEIELKKALTQEKELNALKSQFINIASHEFRTPLYIIKSTLELCDLLLEREITNTNSDNIKKVQNKLSGLLFDVDKITDLMNDILTLGKAESKILNFNPIIISFQSFVEDYFKRNNNFLRNNVLNFNFTKQHCNVLIDIKLMTQVMENIMSNAIKYSPINSPIDINILHDNDYLRLEIRDFGVGISNKEIPLLFESFFRSKNTSDVPGTGLGMTIIKLFVERNNGKVTVESKLNYGTCVKISLPIIKNN